eukprot:gene7523-10249_t
MFQYVFVPVDNSPMFDKSLSTSGGLEADALRLEAEKYFSTPVDEHKRKSEIDKVLVQQGLDPNNLDKGLYENFSKMGGGVEIISLSLPNKQNGLIGVSMYCDRDGSAKSLPPNTRATSLANVCNHNIVIYGDAFVGRYHDDESLPWERLDFSLADMSSDADWVKFTQKQNAGKKMGGYSTSGTLENMMKQQSTSTQIPPESKVVDISSQIDTESNVNWAQTNEELEIRIKISHNVTSKDVKLTIKSTRLILNLKDFGIEQELSHDSIEWKLFNQVGGVELWSKIDPDCSTWNLESTSKGEERLLVISLTKSEEEMWDHLLK